MNTVTFRAPSEKILDEYKIPYQKAEEGLFCASGPHATAALIASACEAGARVLNMTRVDDVVHRNKRVEGVVINWSAISHLPRQISCLDPISIESKIVIDATGHDAVVCRSLEKRKLLKMADYGPMDVAASEDLIVEHTGEVYPGLLACGMAVSTVFGIPRMGPTFGGMLVSGRKVAQIAQQTLSPKPLLA